MQAYWTESWKSQSWELSYVTLVLTTTTFRGLVTTTIPQQPQGNISYTRLCDGLPRFTDAADEAKVIVTLNSPSTYTRLDTGYVIQAPGTLTNPYGYISSCSIQSGQECNNLWSMFASTRASILSGWSSTNVLTISVASPPTAVTVNGKATPITAAPGQLPTLPIYGNMYAAGSDSTWSIADAYNNAGETLITPGQQVTFTWNLPFKPTPWGPNECERPSKTEVDPSLCAKTAACTIKAKSVELIYFPPPSSTRDLCANTSPGFNKYSQSIYKQPHESVVVNGTTFWQDKAYVRYDTVSAYRRCEVDNGLQIVTIPAGKTYTNTLVAVESRDISSICGWQQNQVRPYGVITAATAQPMNFADLSGPVPESAWQCWYGCGIRDGCSSIVQSNFNPNLAVPPQVRDLDPEWADCVPYFEGTNDPPIALATVVDMFSTTDPVLAPTPGKSLSPNVPTETGRPNAPSDPEPSSPAANPSPPTNPTEPIDNRPPSPPQEPPSQPPPPPLTTSFTDFIPLPTPQIPSDPSEPPSNGRPTTPNDPPADTRPEGQPGVIPPNMPSNPPAGQPSSPITTIGGQPVVVDPSRSGQVIIGTPGSPTATTITPGGVPVVVAGTTLSIAPGGTALAVSGSTTLRPITTIDGKPVFIDPSHPDRVVVGDSSDPSSQQTIGINSDGVVVVSGTTLSLSAAATATAQNNRSPLNIVLSGLPLTILSDGSVSITGESGKQTLKPGGPQISVNGHTIFLSSMGEVVVDGKPYRLDTRPTPESVVITGPNGSKTTIALSQATATSDVVVNKNQASSTALEDLLSVTSGSGRSSHAIITSFPGGSGTARSPSAATSSRGAGMRVAIELSELWCASIGMIVGLLAVCL